MAMRAPPANPRGKAESSVPVGMEPGTIALMATLKSRKVKKRRVAPVMPPSAPTVVLRPNLKRLVLLSFILGFSPPAYCTRLDT